MGKGGSKMSGGYQPTWQAGADQNFQSGQGQYSSVASNLAGYAPGQYQNVYDSVVSNPYYNQAQTGANNASQLGMNFVAPNQIYSSQNLMDGGNNAGARANEAWNSGMASYGTTANELQNAMAYINNPSSPQYMQRAQQDAGQLYGAIPQATAGFGLAMPNYQQGMQNANQTYGLDLAGLSMVPGMEQAAQQVLQTGMDPQRALYDRNYQQTMEQQNAINAQQGVSGSPFAAGVAGQTASNFNIDWNAQQLQNQLNALSGYTNTMGTAGNLANNFINGAASNYANLSNTATNNFNNLTNSATSNLNGLVTNADTMLQSAKAQQFSDQQAALNNAVSRYGTLGQLANNQLGAATSNYGSLLNDQSSAYAGASDLGTGGLNTMTTASMYPNEVYMNQQNQILQALNSLNSGTGQALSPLNNSLTNDLNYMKTGQSATQLQQNATSYNNQLQQQQMGGLGQLAGLALAPFTGGMSLGMSGMGGLMGMMGSMGAGNGLGGLMSAVGNGSLGSGLGLSPMDTLTNAVNPATLFSMAA